MKKCAQYGLMVDIHDEYRSNGFLVVLIPILMTQEGIRGNEEFPDATHNTILPFTRFVSQVPQTILSVIIVRYFGRLHTDNSVYMGKNSNIDYFHVIVLPLQPQRA